MDLENNFAQKNTYFKFKLEGIVKKTIAVILGLGIFVLAGLVMTDQVIAETVSEKNLNRAVIKIGTLTCGGCFSTIDSGMNELEGYSGMRTNLFRKLIAIDFKAPLTAEKISEKLIEIGYPGRLETVETVSEKESFAYLQSKRSAIGSGGGCCSTGSAVAQKSQKSIVQPTSGSCCSLPPINKSNQPNKPNQKTEDL